MTKGPTTPGGSKIYRHRERELQGVDGSHSGGFPEEIEEHLAAFLGPSDFVLHEIVSGGVHVDILQFSPTVGRDFWTFVTCGMSDRPMQVPTEFPERDDLKLAELVLSLPSNWVMSDSGGAFDHEALNREDRWWPLAWLMRLARFPHRYDTWLWADHSIPNGDPPAPLGPGTKMSGLVLGAPRTWPDAAITLRKPRLTFHAVFPVYAEEMNFKLNRGSAALFDLFDRNDVTEILNPGRPRVI